MIARFQTFLPFTLFLPVDLSEQVEPHEFTYAGTKVKLYVPYKSSAQPGDFDQRSELPVTEYPNKLQKSDPQVPLPNVTVDGTPAIDADALQIDFARDSFDRTPGVMDPPIELVLNIANDWLQRLRIATSSPHIRPLDPTGSSWRILFLDDDGSGLDPASGMRVKCSGSFTQNMTVINASSWQNIASLPWGYQPTASSLLLLDARRFTQEVGPAIVLAYTALETRITHALDILASLHGMSPQLWGWVNDRGNWQKEPSTGERFDSLLRVVVRKSLKDEPKLWEIFRNLSSVRNSFAHEGLARLGGRPIDWFDALRLIEGAGQILVWIDALLPEAERETRFESQVRVEASRPVYAPESGQKIDDQAGG
ncbi:hypothetical protein Rhe02_39070 [Rhizocola hellebori]|uniref:Apea-like HEPN domain-containing protein n=1 Tax=Rhizocola hellebori TaxID=1392758 RepID=A0A8J3QA40_9ACTN|nr:hypothetical protein [Rhizocola hellebori]GIH05840.1 hypothetical protein Rhe02_39070 [Rhizocola hellebori]